MGGEIIDGQFKIAVLVKSHDFVHVARKSVEEAFLFVRSGLLGCTDNTVREVYAALQ